MSRFFNLLVLTLVCCSFFSIDGKSQNNTIEILISPRTNVIFNRNIFMSTTSFNTNHRKATGSFHRYQKNEHSSNYPPMVDMRPNKSFLEVNSSQYFQYQEPSFRSQALGLGVEIIGALLQGTRGL
jgi:hypothetical protein